MAEKEPIQDGRPALAVPRGPLGRLVDSLGHRRPVLSLEPAAHGRAADPQALQFFKRTWSRLAADQRLAQSRAALPGNAGPLNSQHLVHRSLMRMRELSPEYLEHFVAYVDALQWLERANEHAESPTTRRSLPARR